jgi:hypothetical protein
MCHQHPYSKVKFSPIYQHWIFNIFLYHKLSTIFNLSLWFLCCLWLFDIMEQLVFIDLLRIRFLIKGFSVLLKNLIQLLKIIKHFNTPTSVIIWGFNNPDVMTFIETRMISKLRVALKSLFIFFYIKIKIFLFLTVISIKVSTSQQLYWHHIHSLLCRFS